MSPRAAWRLASLGYESVFDYVAGKADWLAYDLPWHGTAQLVASHVTRDVVTCRPDAPLHTVQQRLERSRLDLAVVVTDAGVVLGRLSSQIIGDHQPDDRAAQAMTEGPTTIRPSEELDALVSRMRNADVDRILVTYPDGRLTGVFERDTV